MPCDGHLASDKGLRPTRQSNFNTSVNITHWYLGHRYNQGYRGCALASWGPLRLNTKRLFQKSLSLERGCQLFQDWKVLGGNISIVVGIPNALLPLSPRFPSTRPRALLRCLSMISSCLTNLLCQTFLYDASALKPFVYCIFHLPHRHSWHGCVLSQLRRDWYDLSQPKLLGRKRMQVYAFLLNEHIGTIAMKPGW